MLVLNRGIKCDCLIPHGLLFLSSAMEELHVKLEEALSDLRLQAAGYYR